MRMPRISIAVLMAAIAIVAADCAIVSWASQRDRVEIYVFQLLPCLPTASLLLLVLIQVAVNVRRSGEGGSFALGFVIAGFGAAVLILLGFAIAPNELCVPIPWAAQRIGVSFERWSLSGVIALIVAIWTVPQLLVACSGGLLARRIGLKLVIEFRRPIATASPEIPVAAVPEPAPAA